MDLNDEGRAQPAGGSSGAPAGPVELQFDVTGSYNLSCTMCLVAYRPR